MFIACVIVSALLAFLSLGSGLAKINEIPQVKQLLQHVGAWGIALPLGLLEIAGAVGLIVGLVVAPIGIAAAAGLTIYFFGAVVVHLRVRDPLMQVLNPFVPMLIALLALWLRLQTA